MWPRGPHSQNGRGLCYLGPESVSLRLMRVFGRNLEQRRIRLGPRNLFEMKIDFPAAGRVLGVAGHHAEIGTEPILHRHENRQLVAEISRPDLMLDSSSDDREVMNCLLSQRHLTPSLRRHVDRSRPQKPQPKPGPQSASCKPPALLLVDDTRQFTVLSYQLSTRSARSVFHRLGRLSPSSREK